MYVLTDVPKDILDILDTCINEKGLKPINDELAGNLKHEYSIPKGKAAVSPFLMRLIIEHQKKYPDFFKQAHSTLNYKHCEIELFNLWVNFQKKYEFNPMHVHDGLYSFVIWHKIPYKIDEEKARLKMKEIDQQELKEANPLKDLGDLKYTTLHSSNNCSPFLNNFTKRTRE